MAPRFCFPCTCFLCTKWMMPSEVQKNYLHSSCQLSGNVTSQKYREREQAYCREKEKKKKKDNTNNWTAGNWRKIILREKPFHMLLTRCQPFHKYASCRMEENVWKFSLCEILNGNYRRHVFSTQELETINLVPVKGKLTSEVSTRQGYQTHLKSLRTEAYEILSLQGSIILSQHTIQKFSKV